MRNAVLRPHPAGTPAGLSSSVQHALGAADGPYDIHRPQPTDWLGLAGVAAGLFVFMLMVADRWFPRALPRAVATLEAAVFAVFVLALAGFGISLAGLWEA